MTESSIASEKSLKEQYEILIEEQKNAEQKYRLKMEMGGLSSDPESIQSLAREILDRKRKIDELERQIEDLESPKNNSLEDNEETGIMEYHKNPIIRWLQRLIEKMEQIQQKLKRDDNPILDYNDTRRLPKGLDMEIIRTREYEGVANLDLSQREEGNNHQKKKSWELTEEELQRVIRDTDEVIKQNSMKTSSEVQFNQDENSR